MADPRKVVILGAAGRDFHNFNMIYRDNPAFSVVCFTATQIPNIAGRIYPPELAGKLYPKGIPIEPESKLKEIIETKKVDEVVFSYSDVSHEQVMHLASIVIASGPDFRLLGAGSTMLKSKKPVITICAVRTGGGKSQTTRRVAKVLKDMGKRVVVVRHPMPYGDLTKQICQRFATLDDLVKHECTIEEREEYEPHILNGIVVYAGVDYEVILRAAEKEADFVIWDGGNNDLPFYKPDLNIVVMDPLRAGHELKYHPGEANVRMADVLVINKVDTAKPEMVELVKQNAREMNPNAKIIEAESPIDVEDGERIRGKKVLVIEDGPTVTHGGMGFGAGYLAATKFGAAEIIDPRPYAVGSIKTTFTKYPHLKGILPAMGYSRQQISELEETINSAPCDIVIEGTPVRLESVLKIQKEIAHVNYSLREKGKLTLDKVIRERFAK